MADILLGDKQLARRFNELKRQAQGSVMRRAIIAGATVVRDEAERLAPKRTGEGAKNITLGPSKASPVSASVDVGYEKYEAWHLRFAELGTKFHPAQPHLRPALDGKKDEALAAVGSVLRAGIDTARRA